MFSKSFLVASVLATLASAQTILTHSTSGVVATTTIAQSMPPAATAGFNAAAVNTTIRQQWCRAELDTCPQICGGTYSQNQCDLTTLTYLCVCANGTVPDVTAFAQTLPFYICQQTFIQCMANHPNDLDGQTQCQNNEQCGSRNATAEALAASAASSSAGAHSTASSSTSKSSSGSGSGSATSATAAATSSNVAALSSEITTGAFVAVLMAAFKLFL